MNSRESLPPYLSPRFVRMLLAGLVCTLGLGYLSLHIGQAQAPNYEEFLISQQSTSQMILDRHHEVLSIHQPKASANTRLPWRKLSDWGEELPAELLAAEDRRFWQHSGVDWRAFAASVLSFVQGKKRGGSTLSMQLARQISLQSTAPIERSLLGKFQQMRAAWMLERHWSKAQILEAYLNLVPLRGNVIGLHTGAALYLGVSDPKSLSPGQRIWLLAMIPAPQASLEKMQARACRLFERLADAQSRQVGCAWLIPDASQATQDARMRRQPWPKSQMTQTQPTQTQIMTTLDARVQSLAHRALTDLLQSQAEQGLTDASAVVLDNAKGHVLAYASLSRVFNAQMQQTQTLALLDWAAQPRQSGSILKPFLYAQAFDRSILTASSSLPSVTTSFAPRLAGEKPYRPRYNGHDLKHLVSPREALGGSLNIPAVHVLQKLGVRTFAQQLHALNLMPFEVAERAGLSLALGSAETRLLDLTNAYRCLANDGLCSPVQFHMSSQAAPSQRRFQSASAQLVTDFLSDLAPRNRAFSESNPLNTAFKSAVKTGTSNEARDNWAVGYTPAHTVGVWMGRRDRAPLQDVYGPSGAGRAWSAIMRGVQQQESAPK